MDDEGDEFTEALQTFQEGFEAGIWVRYGMTSMWHKLAFSKTATKNIQTIINVSGQGLDKDEYVYGYTQVPCKSIPWLEEHIVGYHTRTQRGWASHHGS